MKDLILEVSCSSIVTRGISNTSIGHIIKIKIGKTLIRGGLPADVMFQTAFILEQC